MWFKSALDLLGSHKTQALGSESQFLLSKIIMVKSRDGRDLRE